MAKHKTILFHLL